jgi:hypothetical protein
VVGVLVDALGDVRSRRWPVNPWLTGWSPP